MIQRVEVEIEPTNIFATFLGSGKYQRMQSEEGCARMSLVFVGLSNIRSRLRSYREPRSGSQRL